ncbi:uncharacterized protein LOC115770325 [Drosophila novamexicana]|uniref:uncharacterized protein LOC115770325 n=1 Tax=Drosophila novamexicana TaxID=47314 RepID=UPI0011E5946F|nr:uncharacterized protein LOC115770325 [Drosophila novamexicana]
MRAQLYQFFYVLTIVLLTCFPVALGWRSFKIVFMRFDYEANPRLVDVKIQLQNNSESSLNIVVNTLEILDDIELSASVALETQPGNFTNLISKTLNFCKMLKERDAEPLARAIYQDIMRHGKWFKECPIQKDTYTLQDYAVDEELLPSYLPETNFKLKLRLTQQKGVQIFKGMLFGRIDKSKGFNNLKMFSMG